MSTSLQRAARALPLALLLLGGCDGASAPTDDGGTASAFSQQVDRGAGLYGTNCARCHGAMGEGSADAPRLVGLAEGALPLDPPATRSVRTAQFVTAGDVAMFAAANMPADDPASLPLDEYLAILAFALSANGVQLEDELTLEGASGLVIPR